MVLYIYIYNNTPVWECECSIHDPNPNEHNNDLLYSMLVSRVLYLANLTNSRKIAKLNPRESY